MRNSNQHMVTVCVCVFTAIVFWVIYFFGNSKEPLLREEEGSFQIESPSEMKKKGKKMINDPAFRRRVKEELYKPENREFLEKGKEILENIKEPK